METLKQSLNMSMNSNRKRGTSRKINSDNRPHKLIPLTVVLFFFLSEKKNGLCSLESRFAHLIFYKQSIHQCVIFLTSSGAYKCGVKPHLACSLSPKSASVIFHKGLKSP